MMDYSSVSTRTAEGTRYGRLPAVLGLAVVTGLLVLVGFISAPARAEAAEAPVEYGSAALPLVLAGQPAAESGPVLRRSTTPPCNVCGTTTTTTTATHTTTTGHPCPICGTTTTTTQPTTTTPTTTTTTMTHSTVPSTTTTRHAVGHAGTHHSSPPQLAYTGTSPALVPMLAVGALLLILGTLLFFVVPARARRRSAPPTD